MTEDNQGSSGPKPQLHEVDPARLADGHWCARRQRTVGQGDIARSYSADRIAEGKRIREPFNWLSSAWVCTGSGPHGHVRAHEAYRVVVPGSLGFPSRTYQERAQQGDAARTDPNGFYHGVIVSRSGRTMALRGPPALFVPGQRSQLDLF